MESKLMLLCGLMLIFCVTAISAELVAYPHVGCFTGSNILRYFNVKLKLNVRQKGQDDVMRCFEAARAENYDIFAVRKPRKKKIQCLTGSDAKKNLDKFQQGSGCRNGLGGRKSFDIYLVPGAETESCQDLPDGEYQDSLFCNRFYTCMDGRAPVKLCPAGLLFDPATRQCLDKVACPHGKPCIDYDDGKYPHPTSCRKYLVCNKHQAFEAECPSYLWFNDDTKECDSPGNTTCSNDPCKDSPCLNGGNCMVSQEEDLQFKCTCTAGFKGTYCEVKPCSLHPCKNGGTCQELGDGTYECKCKLGYGGQNCTVKVKPCSLHPCKNGGTCQELGDSTYVCKCKLGYWGQNCAETDFDSEILSHHSHYNGGLLKTLLEYLKDVETSGKHWKRCFNARDHSFSAASFHAFCDNKGPTVTLVEVGLDVFGGYTDQAWTSSGGYKNSTRSFLFSLRNQRLEVFKSPVFQHYDKAIHDFSTSGPTFGGGFDLHISSYCHKSKTCFGNIGYSYMEPDGHLTYLSFTGSWYFSCDDYEVFYLA